MQCLMKDFCRKMLGSRRPQDRGFTTTEEPRKPRGVSKGPSSFDIFAAVQMACDTYQTAAQS